MKMIREPNSFLKHLKVECAGVAGIGHDIKMLAIEVNELGGTVPEWVMEGAYDLSLWGYHDKI